MSVVSSPIPAITRRVRAVGPAVTARTAAGLVTEAEVQARRVVGGDGRMSNSGRGRLTARVLRHGDTAVVEATPRGPWQWITTGTDPHPIGAGRRSRGTGGAVSRGRRQRRVLYLSNGRVVAAPVNHPGTAGRGTWRRVESAGPDLLVDAGRVELRRAVRG